MQLVPGVDVLDGTAEAMPLDDDSVDAITVAQAFHWFHGGQALAEIHRVLRRGGALAFIWNRRDLTQPLQRAIEEIVSPHRGETPTHRSDRWRDAFQHTQLFTPLEERHIPYKQELDTEGLVDRIASISFIAALPTAHRAEVLQQTRALTRDLPERFLLHHVTDVYWCHVRKGNSSSAPENLKAST
jgi:SAM-dependent methyltransferase